jgi:hypothetical protein
MGWCVLGAGFVGTIWHLSVKWVVGCCNEMGLEVGRVQGGRGRMGVGQGAWVDEQSWVVAQLVGRAG